MSKDDVCMLGIYAFLDSLPLVFARKDLGKLSKGLINPRTMANRDSLGLGPKGRFLMGRIVCYQRDMFKEWYLNSIKCL